MSALTHCDACGAEIHGEHATDAAVCGGGDGPGFVLCPESCLSDVALRLSRKNVEARRAHYTAQRAKNDEKAALAAAASTRTITLTFVVKGAPDDLNCIHDVLDNMLDDGVFQDAIREATDDNGLPIEFVQSDAEVSL